MAIKKFSAYIAEAPAADYVAPKDDDAEVKGYKPRSKGEEDFANMHNVEKHDYPVDVEAQFSGGVDKKERQPNNGEKTTKQGSSDVNQPTGGGDSKRGADKKQGDKITTVKEEIQLDEEVSPEVMKMVQKYGKSDEISRLKRYDAETRGLTPDQIRDKKGIIARARAKAGIREEVDLGESIDLTEGKVMDGLKKIVDKKSAGSVKFENGKTLKVDMTTANAMLNLHKKINDKNKAKMADQIEKSPEVFMKLMDVAFGGK